MQNILQRLQIGVSPSKHLFAHWGIIFLTLIQNILAQLSQITLLLIDLILILRWKSYTDAIQRNQMFQSQIFGWLKINLNSPRTNGYHEMKRI